MDAATIRRKFLDFFAEKQHLIVPSAPLVLKNDPTLLFTNSGMVQFKDYFLGNAVPAARRIADTQKCLRASGKHNDLEDVGLDTYHHTMFEMLGNWSFGDYFKKEAIAWAWELLTEVYQLPKDRLYVTVFGGDDADGLPADQEARMHWNQIIHESRILYGVKKDNFWEMGDTGPCGPCSEIHVDLRGEDEVAKHPGADLVNEGHPLVIEIWNLVFMEFNRKADGSLERLPAQHVDTGMGFERLCMAIQGKTSNYDTDVFTPLISYIAGSAGITYGHQEKKDIAVRVIADHIRAVSFAIADGQLPSNTGAGYVIRRILRRAVRYAFTFLDFKTPFFHTIVPVLAQQMRDVFPELYQQKEYVSKVIIEEELSFLRTLEKGLKRIESLEEDLQNKKVTGDQAFELYDTYGFPFDLTSLIAREKGWDVDQAGFEAAMQRQRERSKADALKDTSDWIITDEQKTSSFIGYDSTEAEVRIIRYRKIKQKNKDTFQLVFDQTPFYAESGGQVGDSGWIESPNEKVRITETRKENDLIVHFAERLPLKVEGTFYAIVDKVRRNDIMVHHSATHLLHAALRQVLGKHVEQRGSLVNEDMLRFDFSHYAAMTPDEIRSVERMVNEKIRSNILKEEKNNVPLAEAKSMGAMALFGEKYGDRVRVITFDPAFSVELCGGTHVDSTGRLGYFHILSESSVAAGVRRIEAVAGAATERYMEEQLHVLEQVREVFKHPRDVVSSVKNLLHEKNQLDKQLEEVQAARANQIKDELAAKVKKENGFTLLIEKISIDTPDALKNIAFGLRNQFDDLLLILAVDVRSKPMVAVMIGETLMKQSRFHAGNMVKELAREIDGGGGGQDFYATAGGKNLRGLDGVLEKARKLVGH